MKYGKCTGFFISLMLLVLIATAISPVVLANSAEPPAFTVIVSSPPDDLTLSVRFADGSTADAIRLQKEQKGWEAYYRYFYHMVPSSGEAMQGSTLVVQSAEGSFECALPAATFAKYNNLLTLDIATKSVLVGQSTARTGLLVGMRVLLTLLIEGLIFFAFGYRKKASWIAFAVINLLTQGALNLAFTGLGLGSYWVIGFVFYEVMIFIAEMVAFPLVLKEHKKGRAIAYAFAANLASLVLGGLLISFLPI